MSAAKYHTIDPLILETLNLNEKRMNHILDILHGRPPQQYPKTERKSINRTYFKDHSQATIGLQEDNLPPILLNRKRKHQEPSTDGLPTKNYRQLRQDKSQEKLMTVQSRSLQKIANSNECSPENKVSLGKKSNVKQKSARIETTSWEEEVMKLQEEKKKQLMHDYMMGKLKRSKSQEINPKDIYRMQIEELVSQLTPIEELEEAEKRMQRLKRRTKHLYAFDKNYYLRLNQHDILVLS